MAVDSGFARAASMQASTDATTVSFLRLRQMAAALSPSFTSKLTLPVPGPA